MTINSTEEIQEKAKRGRGALPKEDRTIWEKVGLSTSEWEQAKLYFPNGRPTDIVREMLDTCKIWRPEGKPERKAGTPVGERRTPAISRYAKQHGITAAEATNRAWRAFMAQEEAKEK